MKKLSIVLCFLLLRGIMSPLWGQVQEKLDRGVVAVKTSDGVFLSGWSENHYYSCGNYNQLCR